MITKFNQTVTAAENGVLSLDPTLAEINDTLANGRIWGRDAEAPLRLVAFSTPRNGLVSCTRDDLVDDAWFGTQTRRLSDAHAKLAQAGLEIQPDYRWTLLSAGVRG